MRDEDAEAEVHPVAGGFVAGGRLDGGGEPQETARAAEEQFVAEDVLDEHLGAQQQQHDARDHRGDLVEAQRAADRRKRGELGLRHGFQSSRRPEAHSPSDRWCRGGPRRHTR